MAEEPRIRVGNQTSFSAQYVMAPFEYAVANGFDAFEWFSDKKGPGGWSENDTPPEMRSFIRDTARSRDILLAVHAPAAANPLKAEGLELLSDSIRFAQDVGASLVNIHLCSEQGIPAFVEAVTPVVKQLSGSNIKLSFENTIDTTPDDLNEAFRLLLKSCGADAGNAGICFDIGHANLCWATRNDYLLFMDMLDPSARVIHVHMHENYGDFDTHLPVFTGPSGRDDSGIRGLIERLKKRNFSGCIILEQWPSPPSLLNEARNRLMEIIGATTRPAAPGEDDLLERIVEADRRFSSWRNKLGWIYSLLTDTLIEHWPNELKNAMLAYMAIYLRFVATGEVRCGEEGGHHRPSHHAAMSQRIFGQLAKLTTPENAFIIRKIYPWIPSFDRPFMRAEPLTRIRNIAHRNDIPQELKKEIKETLQNKLHRSAGPEDLVTSAALLERITAPGASYPAAFVEEFIIFHEELKEFFNAQSLDERLQSILKSEIDGATVSLVRDFLAAKERADDFSNVLAAFELLISLRAHFCRMLKGRAWPEAQQLVMADIALEDFSFVLLSRLINCLESFTYTAGKEDGIKWLFALHCLRLTVENLRLGGFDAGECIAIEAEIDAWSRDFDAGNRDHLLRLKATLGRCRRLAEEYADKVFSLFPEKVLKLGYALGVAEDAIRVYAEADIRSHPVFQLSKLAGLFLKNVRTLAGLAAWDAIVPGKVSGILHKAKTFADLARSYSEPAITFIEKSEGDETIPAGLTGFIIAHEMPHLCHLAVRARQGGVVFATCEDKASLSKVEELAGKCISLDVSAKMVSIDIAPEQPLPAKAGSKGRVDISDILILPAQNVLLLSEATPKNGGRKAFKAKLLEELSQRSGAGFKSPPAVVIPFGVMEESLRSIPDLEKEYRRLGDSLNDLNGQELDDALARLRYIAGKLDVPEYIASEVASHLKRDGSLIVRSSSNCEDLEGFSGAGLYDSVPNVPLSGIAEAVRKVWASLWNGRAVSARKNSGIPHIRARMAVLIQKLITPEYSFIMHTVNPLSLDRDELYAELAAGLGETLASGQTPGNPYRMVCSKHAGTCRMLAFADFSHAQVPGPAGGTLLKTINYSSIRLSTDGAFRNSIGTHLAAVGAFVEDNLGGPQDIEGVISSGEVYLVQSRPQQGVTRHA